MSSTRRPTKWNLVRRRQQGEKFLRLSGADSLETAQALWNDVTIPTARRCLAARAVGLLGDPQSDANAPGAQEEGSPLWRAWNHAEKDAERRAARERFAVEEAEAAANMRELSAPSAADLRAILRDRSRSAEQRGKAARALRGLRCRDAVDDLISALAEGHETLSWQCMWALTGLDSRRGARRLIEIVRSRAPLPARQEAIYCLWMLDERRAEPLFIQISAAIDTEEEYTRDMATEALGNTCWKSASQRAIASRLFDVSASVKYSALCAVRQVNEATLPCLREALLAKLDDPDAVDADRVIATMAAELLSRAV